jgi:hypothetical protein
MRSHEGEDFPLFGVQQHDGRRPARSAPIRGATRVICVVEEAFNIPTRHADFTACFMFFLGASPLKGVGPQDIDVAGRKRVQRWRPGISWPRIRMSRGSDGLTRPTAIAHVKTTRLAFGLLSAHSNADQVTMAKAL